VHRCGAPPQPQPNRPKPSAAHPARQQVPQPDRKTSTFGLASQPYNAGNSPSGDIRLADTLHITGAHAATSRLLALAGRCRRCPGGHPLVAISDAKVVVHCLALGGAWVGKAF
jgi:hypothetical protein